MVTRLSLPGTIIESSTCTGGLTRLTDKRKRLMSPDLFCTKAEGYRANKALKYKFIDGYFSRSKWDAGIQNVAEKLSQVETKADQVSFFQTSPQMMKTPGISICYCRMRRPSCYNHSTLL